MIKQNRTGSNKTRDVSSLKIRVDHRPLNESPLNGYQRIILERIDLGEERLTKVAKDLGKSKGTVSVQHKNALKEYAKWIERESQYNGQD